jgi:competence protein ComEC
MYLWSDIGWYLSFCAFFGVLVLAPLVSDKFFKKRQPGLLGSIFIETTMAQAVTLPLIVLIFKDVSLISLLANMLILPLIPICMFLTFIAGLGGFLAPLMAGWLAWPAGMLLGYMVNLINLLARLPWAQISISISAATFAYIWLVIIMFWWGLAKSGRSKQQLTDGYQSQY